MLESGHAGFGMHDVIREVLDRLDRHLGPGHAGEWLSGRRLSRSPYLGHLTVERFHGVACPPAGVLAEAMLS